MRKRVSPINASTYTIIRIWLKNYQLISLLSTFYTISLLYFCQISKIFDKNMQNRLFNYVRNVIYWLTYSMDLEKFVNRKSNFPILKNISNSTDNKKTPILIFCDLSKAINLVSHSLLLKKHSSCVRGPAYSCIKSYLSERNRWSICNSLMRKPIKL